MTLLMTRNTGFKKRNPLKSASLFGIYFVMTNRYLFPEHVLLSVITSNGK